MCIRTHFVKIHPHNSNLHAAWIWWIGRVSYFKFKSFRIPTQNAHTRHAVQLWLHISFSFENIFISAPCIDAFSVYFLHAHLVFKMLTCCDIKWQSKVSVFFFCWVFLLFGWMSLSPRLIYQLPQSLDAIGLTFN